MASSSLSVCTRTQTHPLALSLLLLSLILVGLFWESISQDHTCPQNAFPIIMQLSLERSRWAERPISSQWTACIMVMVTFLQFGGVVPQLSAHLALFSWWHLLPRCSGQNPRVPPLPSPIRFYSQYNSEGQRLIRSAFLNCRSTKTFCQSNCKKQRYLPVHNIQSHSKGIYQGINTGVPLLTLRANHRLLPKSLWCSSDWLSLGWRSSQFAWETVIEWMPPSELSRDLNSTPCPSTTLVH